MKQKTNGPQNLSTSQSSFSMNSAKPYKSFENYHMAWLSHLSFMEVVPKLFRFLNKYDNAYVSRVSNTLSHLTFKYPVTA